MALGRSVRIVREESCYWGMTSCHRKYKPSGGDNCRTWLGLVLCNDLLNECVVNDIGASGRMGSFCALRWEPWDKDFLFVTDCLPSLLTK